MAIDTKYLELHRNQYRVRVRIPDAVRHVFGGKPYHRQGLGTGNLKTANLLKGEHVSRFKMMNAEAMASVKPGATIWEEAKALRAASRVGNADDAAYEIAHRAGQLAEETNEGTARAFAAAASGRATPIDDYQEAFIGDQAYRPKSADDLRRAMGWLEAWLTQKHLPATLEALSQPAASDFMRHLMVGRKLSRKSVQKYRSFLTAYWSWLEEQGHRPRNTSPWSGRLPESKAPARSTILEPDSDKRPFTDDEMRTLLQGTPSKPHIADLIRIAALSGMRLEECYLLRVGDTEGGVFNIRVGKTANAIRTVPIHSDLKPIIEGLRDGKPATAYLIDPDAPVIENTDIRSQAASKAFGRYRQSLGLDERPNAKAKSNIDFHSLRRWFIKKARDALLAGQGGYSEWTLAEVVGHSAKEDQPLHLTMVRYPGGSPEAAKRACVEAVKLPGPLNSDTSPPPTHDANEQGELHAGT